MGYYDRKSSWDENYSQYMEKQATMLKDINGSIKQNTSQIKDSMVCMQTGIQTAIDTQTSAIIASHDVLAQTYRQGFNSLNNTIDMGFSGISKQLGYMGAAFSFGLDRISDNLKGMSKEICDRLDKIHDIVNNPLLTQSRELFRRAIANYNKSFFEEALEDIKAAVEKYKTDYLSWFLMGKLFAFGAGEFSNVINLVEAINAFTQAAKYNSPNIAESADARLLSAEIYFYLGTAQYSQSNELMRDKKETEAAEMLAKALKSFDQSFLYSSKMFESLFNSARCKVLQGNKSAALVDLKKLVLFDRNYCIKVFDDTDFLDISDEFIALINILKHNLFINEAEPKFKKIVAHNINELNLNNIPSQFTEELPYFDVMDYNIKFGEIISQIEKVNEPQYNKLLSRKKTASSYDTLISLSKEFRSMNGYRDTNLLAEECEKVAKEVKEKKYQELLSEKKLASSESEFRTLQRKFLELDGYKDANSLADKCEEQLHLKELHQKQQHLEEVHRKEEQQRLREEHNMQQIDNWIKQGLCRYCGGQMGGLFTKKCKSCGKPN
jgi:tetratricopeptide (TPR) repeat protein